MLFNIIVKLIYIFFVWIINEFYLSRNKDLYKDVLLVFRDEINVRILGRGLWKMNCKMYNRRLEMGYSQERNRWMVGIILLWLWWL